MGRKKIEKLFEGVDETFGGLFVGPKDPFGEPKSSFSDAPSTRQYFRDARRTLDERRAPPPREAMKSWDETLVEYHRRMEQKEREALLDSLVPERRCPIRGEVFLRSRQWVVVKDVRSEPYDDPSGRWKRAAVKVLGRRHKTTCMCVAISRSAWKELWYATGKGTEADVVDALRETWGTTERDRDVVKDVALERTARDLTLPGTMNEPHHD